MNIFGQEIKIFQGRGRRVVVQCNSHPEVIITIIFLNKGWQSLFTVIVPQNHWSAKKPDQDDSTLKLLDKRAAGLRLHPLRFTHQMETSWSFFQAGCFSTSAHLQWMGQCLPGTFVFLKKLTLGVFLPGKPLAWHSPTWRLLGREEVKPGSSPSGSLLSQRFFIGTVRFIGDFFYKATLPFLPTIHHFLPHLLIKSCFCLLLACSLFSFPLPLFCPLLLLIIIIIPLLLLLLLLRRQQLSLPNGNR